jgi:hypothetical protein
MQGEGKNLLDHLFIEEEIPNLRSVFVHRCSEKSTHPRDLFWGLEMNTKIFLLSYQWLIS